jgi:hypothetical protein
MKKDRLIDELRRHDPVEPGSLDRAAESDAAARMMGRILAEAPDRPRDEEHAAGHASRGGRRRPPVPAWPALAGAAVVAIAVAILVLGSADDDGGGGRAARPDRLAAALDRAATVAGSQPRAGVSVPWSYLKTRETSISTIGADERSWHVSQVTTREEWMAPDGPGRMRILAGPSRFVGSRDRVAWEQAGRPSFLPLGFGPRTEVHWIAGDVMRRRVEDLPTDPAALTARLRHEAAGEQSELPLPAATLQLIAEDLRSPAASPRLRRALYEAAKEVPGLRYFGTRAAAEGRSGVAIGVTGLGPDGQAQFALIFDPETARPLATEAIEPTGFGAGPTIRRMISYLEAPTVEPPDARAL